MPTPGHSKVELHVRLDTTVLVADTDGVVNPPLCMEPAKMAFPSKLMRVVFEPPGTIVKLPFRVVSPDTPRVERHEKVLFTDTPSLGVIKMYFCAGVVETAAPIPRTIEVGALI